MRLHSREPVALSTRCPIYEIPAPAQALRFRQERELTVQFVCYSIECITCTRSCARCVHIQSGWIDGHEGHGVFDLVGGFAEMTP